MSAGRAPSHPSPGRPVLLPLRGASLPGSPQTARAAETLPELLGRKLASGAAALRAVPGASRAQLRAASRASLRSRRAWQSRTPRNSRTKTARPIRMRFCTA